MGPGEGIEEGGGALGDQEAIGSLSQFWLNLISDSQTGFRKLKVILRQYFKFTTSFEYGKLFVVLSIRG